MNAKNETSMEKCLWSMCLSVILFVFGLMLFIIGQYGYTVCGVLGLIMYPSGISWFCDLKGKKEAIRWYFNI